MLYTFLFDFQFGCFARTHIIHCKCKHHNAMHCCGMFCGTFFYSHHLSQRHHSFQFQYGISISKSIFAVIRYIFFLFFQHSLEFTYSFLISIVHRNCFYCFDFVSAHVCWITNNFWWNLKYSEIESEWMQMISIRSVYNRHWRRW